MTVKARIPSESPEVTRAGRASARDDRLVALGRAASGGDDDALDDLLRALAPDMLRVIRAVVGPTYLDVEDLLQEGLLGFVRALGQFRYESSVSTFALTIAFRHALGAKRRRRDVARWIDAFQRLEEP